MIFRSQPNDFSISAKRFLNRLVSFEACIEGFSVFHPFLYENTKKGSHPSYFLNDSAITAVRSVTYVPD